MELDEKKEKKEKISAPLDKFNALSDKFRDISELPEGFINSDAVSSSEYQELAAISNEAKNTLSEAQNSFETLDQLSDEDDFEFDFDFSDDDFSHFDENNTDTEQDINNILSEHLEKIIKDPELMEKSLRLNTLIENRNKHSLEMQSNGPFNIEYQMKDNSGFPHGFVSKDSVFIFKHKGILYSLKGGTNEDQDSSFLGAGSFGTVYEGIPDLSKEEGEIPEKLVIKVIDLLNIKQEGRYGDAEYNESLINFFQFNEHSIFEKYYNILLEIDNLYQAKDKEGLVQLKQLGMFDQEGKQVKSFDKAVKVALVMEHGGKTCDNYIKDQKEKLGIYKESPVIDEDYSEEEFEKIKKSVFPKHCLIYFGRYFRLAKFTGIFNRYY